MDPVLVDTADHVTTVTLNRPDRLNAVTPAMWAHLAGVFAALGADPDVRVVVVTGAGRAFCSGADLGREDDGGHPLDRMRTVADAALALHRLAKPTIAAVNGVAVGAGMNLALGCDLVVASEEARFSEIFVKRALSVDFGGSWLLPRLVGLHKAKELVLLGGMLDAAEAQRIGLVNRVVPAGELGSAVADWAGRLAAGPRLALSMSKALLDKGLDTSMDQALEAEAHAQSVNLGGPDVAEAMRAFLEKREPRFGS